MNKREYLKSFNVKLWAIILVLLAGCEALIEQNLTDQEIFIIMPMKDIESSQTVQLFWWEPVTGAEYYNLQVVSPSFDSILRLVIDTNLVKEKHQVLLYPGQFEWRIRAYNYSSSTDYFGGKFSIRNTIDLTDQQVVIKSPGINFITNDTLITFEWYPLNNATDYRFELKYGTWEGDYVINPVLTTDQALTLELHEGDYSWGIQAQNQNSSSIFSIRSFEVDTTRPGIPVLIRPVQYDTLTTTQVRFEWTRSNTTGSDITDSLFVSPDSLFLDYVSTLAYLADQTDYTTELPQAGNYFWKVRSTDKAGNIGKYSLTRKFTIVNEE